MAKGKRKSNRKIVSKEAIKKAAYAKQHGLLAKSAKIGNGRLSRAVAKKVDTFTQIGVVPTYEPNPKTNKLRVANKPSSVAVKVNREQLARAKAAGLTTFRGKVVIRDKPEYHEALKDNLTAGLRNDPGVGVMEVIILNREGIQNYADLSVALRDGRLDKYLGPPNINYGHEKVFSFKFFDHHPTNGADTFLDGAELAKYLEHYKWTGEAFAAFELIVLPFGDILGPTPQWVKDRDRLKFKNQFSRRSHIRVKKRAEKKAAMDDATALHHGRNAANKYYAANSAKVKARIYAQRRAKKAAK